MTTNGSEVSKMETAPGDGPKRDQSPLVEQVSFGWFFEVASVTYAAALVKVEANTNGTLTELHSRLAGIAFAEKGIPESS